MIKNGEGAMISRREAMLNQDQVGRARQEGQLAPAGKIQQNQYFHDTKDSNT